MEKSKMFIFLVGPHGVGKTYTASKLLQYSNDILHIDLGPIIRSAHKRENPNVSLGEWISEGEEKYGKNYSDMVLCREIEKTIAASSRDKVLITGSRSVAGMEYIVKHFAIENPTLIYLDGPQSLLQRNYENREKLNLSKEEFKEILEKERAMGLPGFKHYIATHSVNTHFIINKDNSEASIDKIKEIMFAGNVHDNGAINYPLISKERDLR